MKNILMSFWPSVYDRISSQSKLIEFRSRFPDEETVVYMYVSKPCKSIKGVVKLGCRIDMSTVASDSSFYRQAEHDGYKPEKYVYGMPICSFQETTSLSLKEIKADFPRFAAPQSYIILDNNPKLHEFIKSRIKATGPCLENNHITPEDIIC